MVHRCPISSEADMKKNDKMTGFCKGAKRFMRRNRKMFFNVHQGFCRRVNDDSLQPTEALQIRLDRSVEHCPEEVPSEIQKMPCCQLHRWITGRKKLGNVCSYCKTWHVILYNSCFRPFHTQPDLVGLKRWLAYRYNRKYGKFA